jgi:hypothetical protein
MAGSVRRIDFGHIIANWIFTRLLAPVNYLQHGVHTEGHQREKRQ